MDWLKDLEQRVRAAAKDLSALRKQNRTLKARVKKLETEISLREEGGDGNWPAEREEVRRRVDRLADELERLVEG